MYTRRDVYVGMSLLYGRFGVCLSPRFCQSHAIRGSQPPFAFSLESSVAHMHLCTACGLSSPSHQQQPAQLPCQTAWLSAATPPWGAVDIQVPVQSPHTRCREFADGICMLVSEGMFLVCKGWARGTAGLERLLTNASHLHYIYDYM